MTIALHRVASLVYNRPLLIAPDRAEMISSFLVSRMGGSATSVGEPPVQETELFTPTPGHGGSVVMHSPRISRFVGEHRLDGEGRPLPYRMTDAGVAIITIIGELVNRGAWIGASSGLVSYEGIAHQLRTAANDNRVRTIVIDMECPGGEAVGAFEVAEIVRQVRTVKPIITVVNGVATSGGYAIGCGSTRVISIPSGRSGSIGVALLHFDFSQMLANEGVKPTLIIAGAHKADGNPYEPLPEQVRSRMTGEMEKVYGMFVGCVAAGRPNLSQDAIRATEALIYDGQAALDAGLVDALGSFEQAIAEASQFAVAHKSVAVRTPFAAGAPINKSRPRIAAEGASMEKCTNADCGHDRSDHPDDGACTVAGCTCTSYAASDSESAGAAGSDVTQRLVQLQRENAQLRAQHTSEAHERIKAEVAAFSAPLLSKTDLRFSAAEVGVLSEAMTVAKVAAAGIGTVTLNSGQKLNPSDPKVLGAYFVEIVSTLTKVAPNIVSPGKLPEPAAIASESKLTIADFNAEGSDADAARRISTEVTRRRSSNPAFTREDLRKEVTSASR